MDKYSQGT